MGWFSSIWDTVKSGIGKVADFAGGIASGIGKAATTVSDTIGKISDLPVIGNIASTVLSPVRNVANTVGNIANTVQQGASLAGELARGNNLDDTRTTLGKLQTFVDNNGFGKYINAANNFVNIKF